MVCYTFSGYRYNNDGFRANVVRIGKLSLEAVS